MLPAEWEEMGGAICSDCETCIQTEWYAELAAACFSAQLTSFRAYVNAYGQAKSNAEFAKHWYIRMCE